jgi:general secretion pathway protein E
MSPSVAAVRANAAADAVDMCTDDLDFSAFTVLSNSGIYQGSKEERKLLCFLSDGRLLIADGHGMNPHVLSYRARLEKLNKPFRVVFTSMEAISRASLDDGVPENRHRREHTMMQITAKELLNKACRERASDIHIRVRKFSTDFYFRIHSDLVRIGGQTREYGERLLATLYGAMTTVSDNAYKPTERQDASIGDHDKLPEMLYGVRIATAPTSDGSLMVLRLLYNDAGGDVDMRQLGFSDEQAALLQLMKEQPIGMNIISGPTGSGKSTTLQRALSGEILESEGKLHVLTVEDPIEYPIEGAVQTAVTNAGTEEERSRMFSAAIANAMRLDPDTIMIGEIRDRASAQNALRASMTGHQVWTTVHANSAIAVVDRLVDLGIPLSLVTDHCVVTGLISQRLVKVLCPHCKKYLHQHMSAVPEALLQRLKVLSNDMRKICIAGQGCEHCRHKGTTGRTVIAEIILPDAQFGEYMRAGERIKAEQYWRKDLGGKTMKEHVIEKVAAGIVDPRMAEKVVGRLSSPLKPATAGRREPMETIHAI